MITTTHQLELITPCFCAGADQVRSEIRPASIRGELRWWFRALGGTAEQERDLFGSISGKGNREKPTASRIVVRVSDVVESREYLHLPKNLDFFTSSRKHAALAPGTIFSMHLLFRRPVAEEVLVGQTIEAFLLLGAIGLRSGRGLGAFAALEAPRGVADTKDRIRQFDNLDSYFLPVCGSAFQALEALEAFVGEFRASYALQKNAKNAFGYVLGKERHAAVVHLRPVRVAEGFLPVVFYTERPLAAGMRGIGRELREFFQKRPGGL